MSVIVVAVLLSLLLIAGVVGWIFYSTVRYEDLDEHVFPVVTIMLVAARLLQKTQDTVEARLVEDHPYRDTVHSSADQNF